MPLGGLGFELQRGMGLAGLAGHNCPPDCSAPPLPGEEGYIPPLGAQTGPVSQWPRQQQTYKQVLFDLHLFLSDPVMEAVKHEPYPYALMPSGSAPFADPEVFFGGRTPFNELWPEAVAALAFVRAMPELGPYRGLSPITSTVGQLHSWSRLLDSPAWRNEYDAAANAQDDLDRDARRRNAKIGSAQGVWASRVDPLARFGRSDEGGMGRSIWQAWLADPRTPTRTPRKCADRSYKNPPFSGNWGDALAYCEATNFYYRKAKILSFVRGGGRKPIFPFSYNELREVDPFSYQDPAFHRLDFSAGRFRLNAEYNYQLSASEARHFETDYAGLWSYERTLARLVKQLHTIAGAAPEIAQAFGPQLISAIVYLHRERGDVIDYATSQHFPLTRG